MVGENEEINQSLEWAGLVADLLELAELLCIDALHRSESCGAQGEALRDDAGFAYLAGWQSACDGRPPVLRNEPLTFDNVHRAMQSYK